MKFLGDNKQVADWLIRKILNGQMLLGGALQQQQQTTTSSIGPDELPPPYTSNEDRGLPMVTCRVCSAMIDISWKREQHVVKCNQCNEATVRKNPHSSLDSSMLMFSSPTPADQKCAAWKEIRKMSMQLPINLQKLFATRRLPATQLQADH